MTETRLREVPEAESNLVAHARRELALIGNGEEFDEQVIAMVQTFADMGHSGGSAFATISYLQRLLSFQNLSPLTDNPGEWQEVEMGEHRCWQSRRRADAFTYDPTFRRYYTLEDHGSLTHDEFINEEVTEPLLGTEHKEK